MAHQTLTHNELIKLLARQPSNEPAWKEFVARFHEYICAIIYRECKRRNYVDDGGQVEDLAQEVYLVLARNDCHALKKFEGRFENSIFKYLGTTAARVVLYRIAEAGAQKRPPAKKKAAISEPMPGMKTEQNIPLEEMISAPEWDASINDQELREEIEDCLDMMVTRRRHGALYKMIFKYHLYEEFTPKMIQAYLAQEHSIKRIMNIITEVRKDMQICLQKKINEKM